MVLTDKENLLIKKAIKLLDKQIKTESFQFNRPEQIIDYLRLNLELQDREVFAVLFLNNQNEVISYEELFHGSINCVEIHPRTIARRALLLNAASIIIAHNHPSGLAEPSSADRTITDRIGKALGLFEIKVLDHFVIGSGEYVSFAERGWM